MERFELLKNIMSIYATVTVKHQKICLNFIFQYVHNDC